MLDILAFGAHPDDCEISMGGTLAAMKEKGAKIGICDLTRGESGTYGSPEIRAREAASAAEILGLDARETLDIPDGNVRNTEKNRAMIIEVIRKYRPSAVFAPVSETRHPDHAQCGIIVKECAFLAGLEKIEDGNQPYRPDSLFRYPELSFSAPDFIFDVSLVWEKKIKSIMAYESQVTADGEDDSGNKTFIRTHDLWKLIEARGKMAGGMIRVKYGEPFYCTVPPGINDIFSIIPRTTVKK
ncbi:MAG: bacillithiol biosynthesis deacetylase BshB1 [Fibrobacterota bacterium]